MSRTTSLTTYVEKWLLLKGKNNNDNGDNNIYNNDNKIKKTSGMLPLCYERAATIKPPKIGA